jgi:DnaB helicase-like protein/AAA domain-containing protein
MNASAPPKSERPAGTGRRADEFFSDRARYGQSDVRQVENNGAEPALANIEIENAMLGSLINGGRALIDALGVSAIDPNCFHYPSSHKIFNAVAELYDELTPINLVTVTERLRKQGNLEAVGGAATVTKLSGDGNSDVEVAKFYLDELRELHAKREQRRIAKQMLKGDITPEDAREKLGSIISHSRSKREPRIQFFKPSELRDFKPDNGIVLVGDCNIMRGEVFVIGGEPGVGKSLAATQLAVSGATQRDWFGQRVHRQFRTMIVQTENGRYRLRQEFSTLDCDEIEKWVRVSEPPPFGLTLSNKEFQEDIGAALDSFKPECVVFDPWNAAARDDKIREYAETFDALRNLLPTGADKPALGIVAHTRKPQLNERRTGGTALMHLLAGSYILTSVPRCIFVMTRGSQDETDDSVVFFNPKNSNGENARRSAWHRALSGFTPASDFDWKEFDKPPEERKIITLDHIREVFGNGEKRLELKEAAHDLATLVKVTDSAAYNALKPDGKFSANLSRSDGLLTFHSTKIPRKTR